MTDLTDFHRREYVVTPRRDLYFKHPGYDGGYAFECDEDGAVDVSVFTDTLWDSWMRAHEAPYLPPVMREYNTYATIPARGTCACGEVVWLDDPLWNACDCGRWYSLGGQEVNAPHSGPYETGEMLSDIYLGGDDW